MGIKQGYSHPQLQIPQAPIPQLCASCNSFERKKIQVTQISRIRVAGVPWRNQFAYLGIFWCFFVLGTKVTYQNSNKEIKGKDSLKWQTLAFTWNPGLDSLKLSRFWMFLVLLGKDKKKRKIKLNSINS